MSSNSEKLEGKALNNLLVAELQTMRKFTYSLTGSVDDAHDVVQLAVERCLKSGVPADGSRAWLFRVCRNLWIDEIRRRRRKPQDDFEEERDSVVGSEFELNLAEKDLSRRNQLQAVAAAFEKLSDEQRQALSMSAIEGMSYQEIATALELPMGTVMSRIARARLALNQHLEGKK